MYIISSSCLSGSGICLEGSCRVFLHYNLQNFYDLHAPFTQINGFSISSPSILISY